MSPFVPWDDATRAKVVDSATAVYDLFLSRIAEGRGVPVDKVAPSAEGRIFSGQEAKDRGQGPAQDALLRKRAGRDQEHRRADWHPEGSQK